METTITKKVKGATMEAIFQCSNILSIRNYEALDLQNENDFNPESRYKYKITIRHAEGTNANELLTTEINHIEAPDKATHTPGIWKAVGNRVISATSATILNTRSGVDDSITQKEAEANAAYIVKCCNSHDELLQACWLALTRLESGTNKDIAFNKGIVNKLVEAIRKAGQ